MGGTKSATGLDPGELRLGAELSVLPVWVDHPASCPEVDPVLCAEQDLPLHEHHLLTIHSRAEARAELGLTRALRVGLLVPVEWRRVEVEYTLADGEPYAPPYADIHHRDEDIVGLADGEAWLQGTKGMADLLGWARLGATLPWGRTEEDPYALGAQGLEHEHHQLGAGLPLLLGGLGLSRPATPWGGGVRLGLRLPVGTNGKGYRAPTSLESGLGLERRLGARWQAESGLGLVVEGPERWSGQDHPGRQAVLLGGGLSLEARPQLRLRLDVRGPLWQHVGHAEHGDEDGKLRLGPRLAVGLELGRRPGGSPHQEPAPAR